MPVYLLDEEIRFPDPALANKEGLLAIGGDLSPERLIEAYSNGIFPWYSEESPILWWSPDPRPVLFPDNLKVSKSLRQVLNSNKFTITFDRHFEQVMINCAVIERPDHGGTWITDEMIGAYTKLHKMGFAHSVETYRKDKLVGGLYGVSIGKVFFGESMFHKMNDASKVALYYLIEKLKELDFKIIDIQQKTGHLTSLGASMISREDFLTILKENTSGKLPSFNWQ